VLRADEQGCRLKPAPTLALRKTLSETRGTPACDFDPSLEREILRVSRASVSVQSPITINGQFTVGFVYKVCMQTPQKLNKDDFVSLTLLSLTLLPVTIIVPFIHPPIKVTLRNDTVSFRFTMPRSEHPGHF
jgi:hypothetical protein